MSPQHYWPCQACHKTDCNYLQESSCDGDHYSLRQQNGIGTQHPAGIWCSHEDIGIGGTWIVRITDYDPAMVVHVLILEIVDWYPNREVAVCNLLVLEEEGVGATPDRGTKTLDVLDAIIPIVFSSTLRVTNLNKWLSGSGCGQCQSDLTWGNCRHQSCSLQRWPQQGSRSCWKW